MSQTLSDDITQIMYNLDLDFIPTNLNCTCKRKNLTAKIQEPGSVRHDDTLKGFIFSHAP